MSGLRPIPQSYRLFHAHEAIQHPLAPRLLEIDLQFVALDLGHPAVAELRVEDPLAECDVAPPRIPEADRAGLDLQHPRGRALERSAGGGALPAGAAAVASRDVGEGVGAFGPAGAPERGAAGHARFRLDMRLGQLGDEAAGDGRGPLAVDPAVGGVEDDAFAPRPSDRDVGEAALLLQ